MSLALFPLDVSKIVLPTCQFNERKSYGILKGSAETSWKVITTQSYSPSSIQFTAPPPSPGIGVSRKIWLNVAFNLSFTGTNASATFGLLRGPAFVNGGGTPADAPRAYPLSSCVSTLTAKLNNTDVSVNLSDVVQPLLRYHNCIDPLHNYDYSLTPAMMDQYQTYAEALASNRNPLAGYDTNSYEFARGGFVGISNVVNPVGGTTASCTLTVTEPLILSPMMFSIHEQECGFIGLQTFDLNVTFGNLGHLWSHADITGPNANTLTNISVGISQPPALLFNYFTPQEITPIPKAIYYDYAEVNRYPTDQTVLAPGASAIYNSANIQLNSIPRRMYIFARLANSQYQNLLVSNNWYATDTFLSMNSVSVNWNNRQGLLSGASQMDLYNMSVKNGCQLSWTQWSNKVGSVLCVDFGDDIGLNDLEAPGMLGTWQLQVAANFTNTSSLSIVPSLYIIVVSEGTFCLTENRSVAQIGVISRKDVLESHARPMIDYAHAQAIYGGNFFGSIRKLFSEAAPIVKRALPCIAKEVLGKGAGKKKAKKMGGRRSKKHHMRGGQMISRDELREKIYDADEEAQSESDVEEMSD